MPELSGPELAREFAGCCPGVPVLYMSGYSDLAAASVEETAYFIEKPFSPTAILTRVREILDRAKE
jgi:FixJ family two-component response regulator